MCGVQKCSILLHIWRIKGPSNYRVEAFGFPRIHHGDWERNSVRWLTVVRGGVKRSSPPIEAVLDGMTGHRKASAIKGQFRRCFRWLSTLLLTYDSLLASWCGTLPLQSTFLHCYFLISTFQSLLARHSTTDCKAHLTGSSLAVTLLDFDGDDTKFTQLMAADFFLEGPVELLEVIASKVCQVVLAWNLLTNFSVVRVRLRSYG